MSLGYSYQEAMFEVPFMQMQMQLASKFPAKEKKEKDITNVLESI